MQTTKIREKSEFTNANQYSAERNNTAQKKVSPERENLLSRFKLGSRFVVATYKSEQKAQNNVNKIETLYAE